MFESCHDQAQGLAAWELQPPTRVLPLVAGNNEPARRQSLALLLALERDLRRQGHAVVVIEGLNGLLPRDALLGHQAVLRRWLQGVPAGSVVLLHAPLDALAALLGDSVARPLVAMREDKPALVHAYQAVKVLWQAAGLAPIVLQALGPVSSGTERAAEALCQACEGNLGMVPSLWRLEYDEAPAGQGNHSQQDASLLKVLDSALMIEDSGIRHVDHCIEQYQPAADQTVGVSDVHRQRHA